MPKLPVARFRPMLFDALRGYDRTRFAADLGAGLTVGIVALPLAMAFAIASGAKPEAGLFTAIIAGFLVSVLGGTRVQIAGPAGAFIVIVYGIIERYGFANLLISTICAGVLLFALGLFRLGSLIRLIPVPIVIGFTNGIAVLIALSQVKDFFGLRIDRLPGDFFAQMHVLGQAAHTVNPAALAVGLASLLVLFGWPQLFRSDRDPAALPRALRWMRVLPGPIVVLVLATLAAGLLDLPVDTIASRFGSIPQGLPDFRLPEFSWQLVKQLVAPTLTIALLGAIESLLCARVADKLARQRHDPNQELMAQGVANVVAPFFGGLPATGTIARTVTNIRSGASSPVAGMVHAGTLLAIVLAAAPLAGGIPLAALAAILLHVAYNMGEWHEFRRLLRFSVNYRILVLATFALTIVFDLSVAVEVGLVLACLFFIYRISSLTRIEPLDAAALPLPPAPGVAVYSLFGSLFFGAVGKLEALAEPERLPHRALVLRLDQLINMDTTGLEALDDLRHALAARGSRLVLCGVGGQPLSLMQRTGFLDRLGTENRADDLAQALALANR
ncbi:SulP family inorganic anion transporter [Noviherbaspirillum aridicola]|uniref:Sodium-independent anion transporter n=1 Tax=Noviherbaspirillum aridicola TaxID=2849687 RepID=A0ABQ4Q4X4_9BURK|nr:SulP family inorganic anion transporter [Noviherbaspirillum aridicola]GIZ52153.1 sodium-independent anion transporter [Noviherbaspirillum aridicola]